MRTETQHLRHLTVHDITEGDRVTVKSETGFTNDFKVKGISDNGTMALGPRAEGPISRRLISANRKSIVLASEFKNMKTHFRVISNELVTLIDKRGKTTTMRVDLIVGNSFLVLNLPTSSKSMGFMDKLKFLWNIVTK